MSLKHAPEYERLADDIRAQRSGRQIYIANPGNWGDAMIRAGTHAFFRTFDIEVHEIPVRKMTRLTPLLARLRARHLRPVVIYGGGGALTGLYQKHSARVSRLADSASRTVIMPATYGPDTFLRAPGLRRNCSLWRRDEFESRESCPDSEFCHDMAFFLDAPEVDPSMSVGHFFRSDVERSGRLPDISPSRDISALGSHLTPIDDFFAQVGACETVHTDRLHVAIAGALLGRRVHLYANSYFKNRAIFQTSIAPNYPNVTFHDSG